MIYGLSTLAKIEAGNLWADIVARNKLYLLPETLSELYYTLYRSILSEVTYNQYQYGGATYRSHVTVLDYSGFIDMLSANNPCSIDDIAESMENGSNIAADIFSYLTDVDDVDELDDLIGSTVLTIMPAPNAFMPFEKAMYKDLVNMQLPQLNQDDDIYFSIRPSLNRLCVSTEQVMFYNDY